MSQEASSCAERPVFDIGNLNCVASQSELEGIALALWHPKARARNAFIPSSPVLNADPNVIIMSII